MFAMFEGGRESPGSGEKQEQSWIAERPNP